MEWNNETFIEQDGTDAREVVLRYSPTVQPVEERYIQPTPLPGQKREAEKKTTRRRKRGKRIFLCSMLAVLVVCVGMGVWWMLAGGETTDGDNTLDDYDSYRDRDFENRDGSRGDSDRGETTIRRAAYSDEVKLVYRETHGEELSAEEIYEKVNPSTVTVITGMDNGGAMIGTGVIMTEDGYILTNAHVVAGGAECYIVLDTGYDYPARLVGMDEEKDLAVLKIGATGLPAAEFGDSDALKVGEAVYAIGNPLGVELRGTLTDGIVSAIDRDVYVDGVTMTLIQTNAALNNGNSGGPLINRYGQVVGINTMKMGSSSTTSVEGLGFAIPISSAAYMVNDLIACGEIRGEVMIGITVLKLPTTLAGGETALEVQEVTAGGPGEEAGVRAGDYIVTADGEALTSSSDLIRIRRRHAAGEILTLLIERDGERFTAEVVLRAIE